MQIAARRVLEENAKLRAFLREKGHTDDELDTFTNRTGGAEDAAVAGSSRYEDPQHMTAVQGLESMLKATTSYDSVSIAWPSPYTLRLADESVTEH